MIENEQSMKNRGSDKVWKTIKGKNGELKEVANTQIGQQIIMDESIRILPSVANWIKNDCAKVDRILLNEFFTDEEILLEKIAQTFLLLAGSLYYTPPNKNYRHKEVTSLVKKVLPELSFELAWRFLEVIIDYSDYFTVEKNMEVDNRQYKWKIKYVCTLSENIMSKIATEAAEAFFPLPMKNPPLDWSFDGEEIKGGYETHQLPMVVTSSGDIDYSRYSQTVFDSINYIQKLAWRVNEPLLDQVKHDLIIPQKEDFIFTKFPPIDDCQFGLDLENKDLVMSENDKEKIRGYRAFFKEQVENYNAEKTEFESAMGKYRNSKLAIEIAEKYRGEVIYFPHFYDFRGRIYPLPVGLSPQGSDLVKSLLVYDRGEKLTKEGEEWAWAYLATLYGDDKITFLDRIERGKELLSADYREADEPYQFLAHQIELNKFLSEDDYEFNGRIHLDACNSGSQFTSVITGDRAGCLATNVIPTIENGVCERQDAYLLVSEKAKDSIIKQLEKTTEKEEKEVLNFLLQTLNDNGRKICKRPVMVSNYGGTDGGRIGIVMDVMRELKLDKKMSNKKNAALLSKIIGQSIVGVLNGGKAFEQYIQKMNGLIAKSNKAVKWNTVDGFHVVHFKNKELKTKTVSCLLPGSRKRTTIIRKIYSKKANASKMRSAISPNYIHSLDAELLRKVAMRMKSAGVVDTDWIHDSFGAHPNYMNLLLSITKDEFLQLAQRKPLEILDRELRRQVFDSKQNAKSLSQITVPQLNGFDLDNGGLDSLFASEWFFS